MSHIIQIIAADVRDEHVEEQLVPVDLDRLLKAYRATKRTPLIASAFYWLKIRKEPLQIVNKKVQFAPAELAASINGLVQSMLDQPAQVVTREQVYIEINELF